MAVQNLLLLVEARRVGALYFGIFRNAEVLMTDLGVPESNAVGGCCGTRASSITDRPSGSATTRPRRVDDRGRPLQPLVTMVASMASLVPLVDYLVLSDQPHLVAHQCSTCGARYFDRRNACANCGGTTFGSADVETDGEVRSFTIVTFAAPGVKVPFVSAIVDCAGTSVRGNLINVEPDPDHVSLGMKVRLATYSLGIDDQGTEAIGFGFEPA